MNDTYQVDEMEDASEAAAAPHECTSSRVFVSAGEFNQAVGLRADVGGIRADKLSQTSALGTGRRSTT